MDVVLSDRSSLGLLVSLELEFLSMARALGRLDLATTTMTSTLQTDTLGLALCPEAHIHDSRWPMSLSFFFTVSLLPKCDPFVGKGEERYLPIGRVPLRSQMRWSLLEPDLLSGPC